MDADAGEPRRWSPPALISPPLALTNTREYLWSPVFLVAIVRRSLYSKAPIDKSSRRRPIAVDTYHPPRHRRHATVGKEPPIAASHRCYDYSPIVRTVTHPEDWETARTFSKVAQALRNLKAAVSDLPFSANDSLPAALREPFAAPGRALLLVPAEAPLRRALRTLRCPPLGSAATPAAEETPATPSDRLLVRTM